MRAPGSQLVGLIGMFALLLGFAGCASTGHQGVPTGDGPANQGDLGGSRDLGGAPLDQGATGSLTLSPNPILVSTAGPATPVSFTVTSPSAGNVTAKASLTLADPSAGSAAGGVLITAAGLTRGYTTTLTATYGGQTGSATVLIKYLAPPYLDPVAPANPGSYFGTNTTGAKPAWVYPISGALLPRNLDPLTLQFTAATGAVLYRLQIDCPTYSRTDYLSLRVCTTGQCQFTPAAADWQSLLLSCASDTVTLGLAGSSGQGVPIGLAGAMTLQIAPGDLAGVLYYFSTAISGIYRSPAGSAQRQAFITGGNASGCVGCHSVSPDGSRVAGAFGPAEGDTSVGEVNGNNGQSYLLKPTTEAGDLSSFSPDGSMLIINNAGTAKIIDSTSGQLRYTMPLDLAGGAILQPQWSPDGKSIVFVRVASPGGPDYNPSNAGDIMVMPFNGGIFAEPQLVVAAQAGVEYHFHPSWTPDSKWILFASGIVPCDGGDQDCQILSARYTKLRIVSAQGGTAPVDLFYAGQQAGSSVVWPRAVPAPIAGTGLLFFSFESKADYGFLHINENRSLWMSAIDLDKLATQPTQDPSYPPFWVLGQQPSETNAMGSWATQFSCTVATGCPGSYTCVNGQCTSPLQ